MNNLSRICEEGSVHVEGIVPGIYSPSVHQMISTVKGNYSDAGDIKATFPYRHMTDYKKRGKIQLIEKYEQTKRYLPVQSGISLQ